MINITNLFTRGISSLRSKISALNVAPLCSSIFSHSKISLHSTAIIPYITISTAILSLLSLFLVPTFLPNHSYAAEADVTPSITIGNSGTLALTVNPGQTTTGTQNITVATTNYTGYTLTSTTNDTRLASSNGHYITSISTDKALADFNDAEYGYKVDNGSTFHPLSTNTILKSTTTPTDSTSGTFTMTVGVKAGSTTPAGSYSRTFTLTAYANAPVYKITYNANTTDTVSNMPTSPQTTGTVSGTNLTLASNIPTRAGYSFLGWDTNSTATTATYSAGGTYPLDETTGNQVTLYAVWRISCSSQNKICYKANGANGGSMAEQDATANSSVTLYPSNYKRTGYGFSGWNTKADGSGTNYGPMETITTPETMPEFGLILYAKWVPSAGTIQSWTGCSGLNIGDVTALTDQRDNDTYAVAKLADGKCWMIENLRLDNDAAENTSGSLAQGYASGFIGLANPETANFYKFSEGLGEITPTNSLYSSSNISPIPDYDPTYGNYLFSRIPRYINTNTASPAANTTNSENIYSYGNFYSWSASIADTAHYTTQGHNITHTSICPKGWRIPTGYTNGDFSKLDTAIGGTGADQSDAAASNRWRIYPNNFIYSGYFQNNSYYERGVGGFYWTPAVFNVGVSAYKVLFRELAMYPGTRQGNRYTAQPIRCVAYNGYSVHFDKNNVDAAGAMDPILTNSFSTSTVTIPTSTYTRPGHVLAGWSENPTATEPTYHEGDTITLNHHTVLYAIWKEKIYLQNWAGCSSLPVGTTITLYDNRDEQAYTVEKLYMDSAHTAANAKCWMTKNLNLGAQTLTVSELNSTNTHITNGSTISASTFNNSWKTSFSIDEDGTIPQLIPVSVSDSYGNPYGTLYNYAAASAGTYAYNIWDFEEYGNATSDLCPAGWRMPTGGDSGEYKQLITDGYSIASSSAGSTKLQQTLKFPLAGYFFRGAPDNQGSLGGYWSSTMLDSLSMYTLAFDSSIVSPAYGISRDVGYSVRCVAQ